jgi:hypothetical protein
MRPADHILNDSFLEVRAKLLEVAATLDRIDRADASESPLSSEAKVRRSRIDEAIRICLSQEGNRAERLQKLFSRPYEADWRSKMNV